MHWRQLLSFKANQLNPQPGAICITVAIVQGPVQNFMHCTFAQTSVLLPVFYLAQVSEKGT